MPSLIGKVFSKHGGRIIESWQYDAKAPLLCAASVAETGGRQHILIGTKSGAVVCIDDAGRQVWQYGLAEKLGNVESYFVDEERVHSIDAPPTVADINRDGSPEILVGTELGILSCLSLAGKLLWKYNCGGSLRASALVADINGDGRSEVLIGCSNNKLLALTSDGKKLFEYVVDAPVESVPGFLPGPKPLIIFGTDNGVLHAITPAQELVWRVSLESKIVAQAAFFKDDEERRLVVGTYNGDVFCISEHGEVVWQYKTAGSVYGAATVCDINDDGKVEIVVGSCDNKVHAITADGKKLWSFETDFWVAGTPIVADIDLDGHMEVIAGSFDHNVYILDGHGNFVMDYVPGLSGIVPQTGHYGSVLTSDPGEQTGKKLYQYKMPGIIVGMSLVERHNAKPLLVVNLKNGQVNTLTHQD